MIKTFLAAELLIHGRISNNRQTVFMNPFGSCLGIGLLAQPEGWWLVIRNAPKQAVNVRCLSQ